MSLGGLRRTHGVVVHRKVLNLVAGVIGYRAMTAHRTTAMVTVQRTAMAIGSAPEIGKSFTMWGDKTEEEKQAWWEFMRTEWHPYLMAGYATLVHNKNNPYYQEYNK